MSKRKPKSRSDMPGRAKTLLPATFLSNHWPLQIFLLLLATLAVYAHTLDVPFYLDDYLRIKDNPIIYESHGAGALWEYGPMRVVGYLTFALNYQLGRFDTTGYHIVNILIHFLCGVMVFFLARSFMRTPRVQGTLPDVAQNWIPLFAAAIFLLHPLQTQAVTYIVQRLASLAALFYLTSMVAYVRARLSPDQGRRFAWYTLCAISGLLGFFTKQNTFTLPFALLLMEVMFFHVNWKRMGLSVGGAALGLAGTWIVFAVLLGYNPLSLEAMQQLTTETEEISRSAYLATQLPILWMYLRLFIWPVGLHLDYGTTALTGFMHLSVFVSLALHIAVIVLGVWSWKRSPLVSFAILFYYLAHGIESSFIPIRDVVFEHRTYLPNLGLALLSGWILFDLLPRRMSMRAVTVLSLVIVIALGVTTWRRNQVWRDPITLWTSNTEEAPTKVRAWVHLGNYYIGADRPRDAERASMRAISIQLEQDSLAVVDRWAVCNLITSTYMLKNYDRALALTDQFIDQPMTAEQLTRFYVNQGLVYLALGRNDEAEVSFQKAIYLRPTDIPARENYARVLAHLGRHIEAVAVLEELLRIDPGNEETRRLLQQFRTDIRRHSP